jgi:hypothetical protein
MQATCRIRPLYTGQVISGRRLAPLALAAFWAAVYLPPLLAGRCLPARDVAATQAPWRVVWRQQVAAGSVPLWDPTSNQGRPLLANPNAMALYPGTLLFLVLAPEEAAAWHVALHHLLLLAACWLLARRAGADPDAAAVAAAATATAGVAWSLVTLLNSQASLAWGTLALAQVAAPPAPGTAARRALGGGAALGLALLAGEPVIAALAALAWAVVAAAVWRRAAPAAIATAAAAAIAVAAPVLLPLLAVYPDTLRAALGAAPGALAADTLAPRRWLELLFPRLLGAPLGDAASGFWAAASFPWQRYFPLVFVGAVPLLALPLARRRSRPLWPWWTVAAAGVGGSVLLGWPAAARAATALPGMDAARYGIKLLLLALLAMPPLIAAGYRGLVERPAARRRAAVGVLALAVAAGAVGAAAPGTVRAALGRLYPASAPSLAAISGERLRAALLVDATALALPAATLLATAAAAPLCGAALVANALGGAGVLAFDDAGRWREPPALAAAVPAGATVAALAVTAAPADAPGLPVLDRFWRARAALVPEYGTRWGVGYTLTRGPDGLEPIAQELVAAAAGHLPLAARVRVARALGAAAAVTAEPVEGLAARPLDGVWLLELDGAPAGAYLARRALPCDSVPAAVRALADPGFRPGHDAVVEGIGGAAALGAGELVELPGRPHRRRFAATLAAPGLLVVRQSTMRCWRATVDGRAAAVETVNGAQLGVRMPAGAHVVEVYVDPLPFRLGLAGPLLVALALAATRRRAAASPGRSAASGDAARSTPATPPAT